MSAEDYTQLTNLGLALILVGVVMGIAALITGAIYWVRRR